MREVNGHSLLFNEPFENIVGLEFGKFKLFLLLICFPHCGVHDMPADYARLCSILNLTQAFKERKKDRKKSPNTFNSLTLGCHKCFGQRWPTSSYVWKESKVGKWLQKIGIFLLTLGPAWPFIGVFFFLLFCIQIFWANSATGLTVAIGYQSDSLSVLVNWSDFGCEENNRQGHNFWLVLVCH